MRKAIERFREAERAASENGLGFGEAMRLVAGADVAATDIPVEESAGWAGVVAGSVAGGGC